MRLLLSAFGALSLALPLATPVASPLSAQAPARQATSSFEFTIDNMMRGPEVTGREPANIRWTPDSRWIYFMWVEPGTDWREPMAPYRVRATPGSRPEKVTRAHMDSVGPYLARGELSGDRRQRAIEYQGDLYLMDARSQTMRRLTDTPATERSPRFDVESQRLFFVRDDNVFSIDIQGGTLRQLTDIRSSAAPRSPQVATGQRGFLEQQQRELFEVIRDQLRRDSIAAAERDARAESRIKPLFLQQNERVGSLEVAPDGRALLISTGIPAQGTRQTGVPQFVTASGYTEELRVRTKVGDEESSGRIAFVSLPSGETKWLKLTPADSVRPSSSPSILGWNPQGTSALVMATSNDFKRRYLSTISSTGEARIIDTLVDTAWVAGPCFRCGGWYDNGRRIWYVSETSGYAHLYTAAPDGSDRRQLTAGNWELLSVELSDDGRYFMISSHEETPFERHFYRMPVNGGVREKLTHRTGGHSVTVSPDGRWMANVFSTSNRPPELFLMEMPAPAPQRAAAADARAVPRNPNAQMHQLTTSPTAEWLSHPWIQPEIVMIRASDGVEVPARIYRPQDVGAQPNGAGAIFVHGAGYLHNVHNYWSTYSREYMFNHFLASKGYVVLDIDYRGSAGYGRDWRTAIYRHMGGRDLQDHVDGSRYLQQNHGIDPKRVGIYGGSYGGFITLMALFTEPEWFGAGAALRSVTDWAHYNHGYTARILNNPQEDSIAYRRSSPIYFAEGLQDPLLIAHGMVDVNVHFQDVVRLSQRLIELGKTDWEMAVYPVEDHAFVRPSSWTDEYRRIYELFERHLPVRTTTSDGPANQR
jgi:dipeptidyl aminopeptidase/acylaminoacyl peptidase